MKYLSALLFAVVVLAYVSATTTAEEAPHDAAINTHTAATPKKATRKDPAAYRARCTKFLNSEMAHQTDLNYAASTAMDLACPGELLEHLLNTAEHKEDLITQLQQLPDGCERNVCVVSCALHSLTHSLTHTVLREVQRLQPRQHPNDAQPTPIPY